MPVLIHSELRHDMQSITELDMTPYHAEEYLENKHFHSFLKGCECEMKIIPASTLYKTNVLINKYCKTHGVMCSKTGWEIGWYGGSKSEKPSPVNNRPMTDEEVLEIREQFKTKSSKELCKEYNLSYSTMYGVLSGSRYKHLNGTNLLEYVSRKKII